MEIKLVRLIGFDLQAMGWSRIFAPRCEASRKLGTGTIICKVINVLSNIWYSCLLCLFQSDFSLPWNHFMEAAISVPNDMCVDCIPNGRCFMSPVSVYRQSPQWPSISLWCFALQYPFGGVSWNWGIPKTGFSTKNGPILHDLGVPPWLSNPPCVSHGCCIPSKFHGDRAEPQAYGTGSLAPGGEDASSEAGGEECSAPGSEWMRFPKRGFPMGFFPMDFPMLRGFSMINSIQFRVPLIWGTPQLDPSGWIFVYWIMPWVHHVGAYKGSWEIFCKNPGVLICVGWHCAQRVTKRRASRNFHAHQIHCKWYTLQPTKHLSGSSSPIVVFVTCYAWYYESVQDGLILFWKCCPHPLNTAHTETHRYFPPTAEMYIDNYR